MIDRGATDLVSAPDGPCRRGRIELLNWLIQNMEQRRMHCSVSDWNRGLYAACIGGHKDIAVIMIRKGAKNFNMGLRLACIYGHKDLVELMITNGAWALNSNLEFAQTRPQRNC